MFRLISALRTWLLLFLIRGSHAATLESAYKARGLRIHFSREDSVLGFWKLVDVQAAMLKQSHGLASA